LHPDARARIVDAQPGRRVVRSVRVHPIWHPGSIARLTDADIAMKERFERHRQPWTPSEIAKLHQLAAKSWSLRDIATALKRSEESVKIRAKLDKLLIASKH